jgi:hypothetical protein
MISPLLVDCPRMLFLGFFLFIKMHIRVSLHVSRLILRDPKLMII